ncbi:MAG: hypothetical protein AAB583_03370, partial [Patescibacteria group bacterium]
MLIVSYNISPKLKDNLYKIEIFRRKILLSPMSPKTELKLRWQGTFNKIRSCLRLSGNKLVRNDIVKLLSGNRNIKMSQEEKEVLKYKKALDYITQNWLGSDKPVTSKSILSLYQLTANGKLSKEKELEYLLSY